MTLGTHAGDIDLGLTPPVTADDPKYAAYAAQEADFWSRPQPWSIDVWARARRGPLKRYYNRRLTGNPRAEWYDAIRPYGPFRRGVVLGSGSITAEHALLRANPELHLTFCDIDGHGLEERSIRLGRQFEGRISCRQVDLNFASFETGAYDVALSSGVLHHLVNLEQLVDQVRGSLVPGGLFFFHDFVGPSRFRYAPAQYRMFEVIYERERKRRPKAELPPVSWMEWNMPQHSPFEAIRSSDTLGVLASRMEPLSVRTVGAVTELLLFSRITRNVSPETQNSLTGRWLGKMRDRAFRPQAQPLIWERLLSPRALKELILADELLSEAGWGEPGTALAVYRRQA